MTQEEKDLLLRDLCARLPYGFKYQVQYSDTSVRDVEKFILDDEYSLFDAWMVHEIKPYLRLLSSMTKEEEKELESIRLHHGILSYHTIAMTLEVIDWYYKHHFDVRFLIELGLAIEAPEGMYN